MHLVVCFLGYLGYLFINLEMKGIKQKLSISAVNVKYIIVGKEVQNMCTKDYKHSYFFPSFFLMWTAPLILKIDYSIFLLFFLT